MKPRLVLTADIGNTTTGFGLFQDEKLVWRDHLPTDARRSAAATADWLRAGLAGRSCDPAATEFGRPALASVVPAATAAVQTALAGIAGKDPILADWRSVGLDMAVEQPETVGADRLVCALAAYESYAGPLAVIDLGTATTLSVVDARGCFIGGMISPGLQTAACALHHLAAQLPLIGWAAAQLPPLELSAPPPDVPLIGTSTAACMKSGIIRGTAAMIDGLTDQIEAQMAARLNRIITGGLAGLVLPFCRSYLHHEPDLLLKGLLILSLRGVTS